MPLTAASLGWSLHHGQSAYGTLHASGDATVLLVQDTGGVFGSDEAAVAAARREVVNGRVLGQACVGVACALQVVVHALGHTAVVTAHLPVPSTASPRHGVAGTWAPRARPSVASCGHPACPFCGVRCSGGGSGGIVADPVLAAPLTRACRHLNLEPTTLPGGATTLSAALAGYEGTDGRM